MRYLIEQAARLRGTDTETHTRVSRKVLVAAIMAEYGKTQAESERQVDIMEAIGSTVLIGDHRVGLLSSNSDTTERSSKGGDDGS